MESYCEREEMSIITMMSILQHQTGWRGSERKLKPQLSQELSALLCIKIQIRWKGLTGFKGTASAFILFLWIYINIDVLFSHMKWHISCTSYDLDTCTVYHRNQEAKIGILWILVHF